MCTDSILLLPALSVYSIDAKLPDKNSPVISDWLYWQFHQLDGFHQLNDNKSLNTPPFQKIVPHAPPVIPYDQQDNNQWNLHL